MSEVSTGGPDERVFSGGVTQVASSRKGCADEVVQTAVLPPGRDFRSTSESRRAALCSFARGLILDKRTGMSRGDGAAGRG